jgi:hypothetical protein
MLKEKILLSKIGLSKWNRRIVIINQRITVMTTSDTVTNKISTEGKSNLKLLRLAVK